MWYHYFSSLIRVHLINTRHSQFFPRISHAIASHCRGSSGDEKSWMKSWQFITPTPLSCPVQRHGYITSTILREGRVQVWDETFRIFASRTQRQFSNRRQGRSSLTGNGDKLFQSFSVSRVFLQRRLQWRGLRSGYGSTVTRW